MTTEQLNAIVGLVGYFDSRVDKHEENADGTVTVWWRLWGTQENVVHFKPDGSSKEE